MTNNYWFEAITPTKLYKAPALEFQSFIRSDVRYFEAISRQNIIFLRAIIYRLQHIILGKAGQTVASIILVYAKLLGIRKEGKNEVIFKIPITHQHISFSAGLTRETTSVEIKKLQDSGLIKYNGRKLVICDITALEKEAFV